MADYELTMAAENDLQGVAAYTLEKWGEEQGQRYARLLQKHFVAIGQGDVRTRTALKRRPEVLVSRCEHHYVFHLVRKKMPAYPQSFPPFTPDFLRSEP